jgi:hypothetical protein
MVGSNGAVTLGDIADKIRMLEVACSRCERRGRLNVTAAMLTSVLAAGSCRQPFRVGP